MFMSTWQNLAAEKKRKVVVSSLVILGIYLLVISISATTMYRDRALSNAKHALRMNPVAAEPGRTPPDPLPDRGEHVSVKVGTYIDEIDNLSIRDSMWNVNFYVWFGWTGDAKLDPGGKFLIVDGVINKKELMEEYHDAAGNYQRYRVSAKIIKYFDTSRVPVEDHMLNIYIEDGVRDGTRLRYVADEASNVSSRVTIPGFRITGASNVVKTHTYRSSYGDPKLPPEARKVFSQYIAAVQIKRIDFGFFLKVFIGLYAGLLLTLSSFFVKASDVGPRFGLPTGAYFGAVANSYIANGLLPSSGTFGLIDHVAGVGLLTIFISIAMALLSNYFSRKDDKDLSFVLDRTMFWVVALCCAAANVTIPLCAAG